MSKVKIINGAVKVVAKGKECFAKEHIERIFAEKGSPTHGENLSCDKSSEDRTTGIKEVL